jgi:hypothetical protein
MRKERKQGQAAGGRKGGARLPCVPPLPSVSSLC